jgi:penicillin-binding protein 1A
LQEVVQSGTGHGARLRHWQAYGKTGTTTGNADAWFIGWSEGRVLGVWMGRRRGATGVAIAGKDAPAEFFRRVSNEANEMMDYRAGRRHDSTHQVAAKKPGLTTKAPERRLAQVKPPVLTLPSPTTRNFIPQSYAQPGQDELWPEEPAELLGRW